MSGPSMYGLEKCSTCAKARNWLDRHRIDYRFVDYREHPVSPEQLGSWAEAVGGWEKLVNRTSMTWRNLPDARKTPRSDPEWLLLIREYPALVRRPLLAFAGGRVVQRFTEKQYSGLFL
ncbi:MAG: Spx/MgsR family RNA polymerase-binding regulatory protein [Rhodanobacteraceae bacterium]